MQVLRLSGSDESEKIHNATCLPAVRGIAMYLEASPQCKEITINSYTSYSVHLFTCLAHL